jgi:hypothetical protein
MKKEDQYPNFRKQIKVSQMDADTMYAFIPLPLNWLIKTVCPVYNDGIIAIKDWDLIRKALDFYWSKDSFIGVSELFYCAALRTIEEMKNFEICQSRWIIFKPTPKIGWLSSIAEKLRLDEVSVNTYVGLNLRLQLTAHQPHLQISAILTQADTLKKIWDIIMKPEINGILDVL